MRESVPLSFYYISSAAGLSGWCDSGTKFDHNQSTE